MLVYRCRCTFAVGTLAQSGGGCARRTRDGGRLPGLARGHGRRCDAGWPCGHTGGEPAPLDRTVATPTNAPAAHHCHITAGTLPSAQQQWTRVVLVCSHSLAEHSGVCITLRYICILQRGWWSTSSTWAAQAVSLMRSNAAVWRAVVISIAQLHVSRCGVRLYAGVWHRRATHVPSPKSTADPVSALQCAKPWHLLLCALHLNFIWSALRDCPR